ncbi:MAG: hypothetical protein QF464_13265, partial [Myxococcota bacterium]|nr:hypothetical protein [Myxococcota bacterium]
ECEEGYEATSANGLLGCCTKDDVDVSVVQLNPHCPGSGGTCTLYVQVGQDGGPWSCSPYTLYWGDN